MPVVLPRWGSHRPLPHPSVMPPLDPIPGESVCFKWRCQRHTVTPLYRGTRCVVGILMMRGVPIESPPFIA